MREICQCNCSLNAPYRTPWCDLLKSLHGSSAAVLHLWYKLDWLLEEVDKRTAYLGKFRRTEETKHLLDLINMTPDEKKLFIPFAKAAMADVFDVLHTYMPTREKAYFWREGKTTVVIPDEPTGDFLQLSETTTEGVDQDGYIIVDDIPVDSQGNIRVAETGVDANNYIVPVDPASLIVYFHKGDYVLYKGKLYMAIEDGDSTDITGKLVPTEDYRESIHYGIDWQCCVSNINAVEPLDTAVFEALTARIIYKWLSYSYPDEAPRFQAEYEEHLEAIRRRCGVLKGPQIVNRIPRMI